MTLPQDPVPALGKGQGTPLTLPRASRILYCDTILHIPLASLLTWLEVLLGLWTPAPQGGSKQAGAEIPTEAAVVTVTRWLSAQVWPRGDCSFWL